MNVLCVLPEDTTLQFCVESLFILLMGSYLDKIANEDANVNTVHEWACNAVHAIQLMRIAKPVFQRTGWIPACERLGLEGINITTPFNERLSYDKLLWVRQDGPGFITFRRSETTLYAGGKGLAVFLHGNIEIDIPVNKLKHFKHVGVLKPGALANVVIEIRTDGHVHQRQFGRLPLVGPYSDWQSCLGFAIRLEFMTPDGLHCHYVQKKKDHYNNGGVPSSYLEVSAMLAAFRGIVYNPISPWRKAKAVAPFRVVKLGFDNLSRKLLVKTLYNTSYESEVCNFRILCTLCLFCLFYLDPRASQS